jgi:bifunctional UDP-N-acetylglucosamine pyrophosphorylase/glucosamine-1-phosphate N-acetyltransferase
MMDELRVGHLRTAGVTLVDPASTWIDSTVQIEAGTVIHPNVVLQGSSVVGRNCEIQSFVRISNSTLGDEVKVNNFCVVVDSTVASRVRIGPFAHLRPGTDVRDGAHVGNFVELKNTVLGEGSKANHLSYVGDATVGAGVNIGAGTITCNFDGVRKSRTTIEDGVFIGSDTQLIAPVSVGAGAYIAAGSSITKDVPPGALAVARGRQTNIEGWAEKRRRKG